MHARHVTQVGCMNGLQRLLMTRPWGAYSKTPTTRTHHGGRSSTLQMKILMKQAKIIYNIIFIFSSMIKYVVVVVVVVSSAKLCCNCARLHLSPPLLYTDSHPRKTPAYPTNNKSHPRQVARDRIRAEDAVLVARRTFTCVQHRNLAEVRAIISRVAASVPSASWVNSASESAAGSKV